MFKKGKPITVLQEQVLKIFKKQKIAVRAGYNYLLSLGIPPETIKDLEYFEIQNAAIDEDGQPIRLPSIAIDCHLVFTQKHNIRIATP